jgi:hypothetical protein
MPRLSCPAQPDVWRLRAPLALALLAAALGWVGLTLAANQAATTPTPPPTGAAASPAQPASAPRSPDAAMPTQPGASKPLPAAPHGRHQLASPPPAKLVDINSASRAELMTLPGISAADADRIIASRPYLSKAELVTKNVLGEGPYVSVRRHVVAVQKNPPKAPKPAAKAASQPASKP